MIKNGGLLESFPTREEADVRMHEYAAKLVEHEAQKYFGVYVAPVAGWYGVYIRSRRHRERNK